MDEEALVRDHYGGEDLEQVVMDALQAADVDVDHLRVEDLAGLDQLHAGSSAATEYLLDALELSTEHQLLDVGCGIGGPARMAATRYGCHVTGIDLSPDFVALAQTLNDRLDLGGRVSVRVGSATDLPYDDDTFDRAMLNHVGMNISAKARVFAEVRRVLRTGGLFAVYEQMRTGDGDLVYPMPWADDQSSSFVETRERYAELLTEAGFAIEGDEDRTAANAAGGPPAPGTLGPDSLFGPGFAERLNNNILAAMEGKLSAVLMVARAV